MRIFGKWLVIGLLVGGASGCARMDQPIRPQYEIGEPYCVIRERPEPVFDVKQAIGKLFAVLSIESLRSQFK